MAGLVDGLGGEEVNQDVNVQTGSVISTGPISGATFIYGKDIEASTSFSGLNANITGSVLSGGDRLQTVSLGSPGGTDCLVQAGSAATAAGSGGFIALRSSYGDAEYAVILTPFSGGSIAAFTSGVQNASSGVSFVGGPSNRYHWMAVGRP